MVEKPLIKTSHSQNKMPSFDAYIRGGGVSSAVEKEAIVRYATIELQMRDLKKLAIMSFVLFLLCILFRSNQAL